MIYNIRSYASKLIGESGKYAPTFQSKTDSYATAMKVAKDLEQEYGYAVICNTETGNRIELGK